MSLMKRMARLIQQDMKRKAKHDIELSLDYKQEGIEYPAFVTAYCVTTNHVESDDGNWWSAEKEYRVVDSVQVNSEDEVKAVAEQLYDENYVGVVQDGDECKIVLEQQKGLSET